MADRRPSRLAIWSLILVAVKILSLFSKRSENNI